MKPSWEEIENYRTHEHVRRMVDQTTCGAFVKLRAQLRHFLVVAFGYKTALCPQCGSDLISPAVPYSKADTHVCYKCEALFEEEKSE